MLYAITRFKPKPHSTFRAIAQQDLRGESLQADHAADPMPCLLGTIIASLTIFVCLFFLQMDASRRFLEVSIGQALPH